MKRIIKNPASQIISENLKYRSGNTRLTDLLLKEQKNFCAYTEEYIAYNDSKDIEHFNPNLKGTEEDGYTNWYMVKHLPNQRKSTSWLEPILYPFEEDFEERIIYSDGAYFAKPDDIEATNLITLLDLNNIHKVSLRKRYIKRRKESLIERNINSNNLDEVKSYFQAKIDSEIEDGVKYLRAIQEEFKINIWEMIPEIN